MTNINSSYKISRTLHWLCAFTYLFLAVSMPIALDYASNGSERRFAHDLHQSVATLFTVLLILRFSWMTITKDSGLRIEFESKLQLIMARINHTFLYFLMITTPLTGFLFKITSGKPIMLFDFELLGVVDSLIDKDWKYYTSEVHYIILDLFYVLIFLHIAGACLHFANRFKKQVQ
mgnify:CR=1 FL=1